MATNPIYIETEEEIPEVVERLRHSASEEVPLVLPMRSRLGQSRFNFQILRQYAGRFGKRITIITAEAAVQQMAEESGLRVLSAVDEMRGDPALPSPGRTASAAAVVAGAAQRVDAGSRVKVAMTAPDRLITKLASESHPGRFLLYTGAALVVLVATLWTATFVPSASVTLVAEARPFSQDADLTADPGKAPIRVRVASIPVSSSQSFKATGVKDTPAALATGAVTYTNKCPTFDFKVLQGTRLVNNNGIVFAQTAGDVTVDRGQSVGNVAVTAVNPGASGNVGDHTITQFQGGSPSCLTVTNPQATGGGADEQKQPQISQGDYDAARAQLEQQLRQQIQSSLTQQTQAGETLAALVNYDAPDVNTDHKVGETVGSFTMQMNLRGEGAFYLDQDVRKALQDNLAKHVPADSVLTDNKVQYQYQVTEQDPGGHLRFHGTAAAFIAPKINYDQVRSKLNGKPTSQALSYLRTLPVQTADIKQQPFALPLMPFLSSRIDIKYVVQAAPASQSQ